MKSPALRVATQRVRAVSDEGELAAVGRLRYETYVRRLGRQEAYADHAQETVLEPLDRVGVVFAAFDGARAIGTVRVGPIAAPEASAHRELYGLCDARYERDVFSTKLIVDPATRGGRLALELASSAFAWSLEHGVTRAWLDCNAHMRRFFERLGYKCARAGVQHPLYGEVTVMFIEPLDRAHLAAAASPFLPLLERLQV